MLYVGNNIRYYRKKANHKQATLATYLNLTQGHYSAIENDKSAITLEQAKMLADFLKLRVDDLVQPRKYDDKVKSIYLQEFIRKRWCWRKFCF